MAGTSAHDVGGVLEAYAVFLRGERGLSPLTIELYGADVRRFLRSHGGALSELTPGDVSLAVLAETGVHSPSTVRRYGCALRSFLRWCYLTGLVDQDLSAAALPVSGRRRSLLPVGLTPSQESALLGSCDRRRSVGRRDYAAILLMLRLGLRAREVAELRLEDLDWHAGQITVRGKGNRVDLLPLPVDVGEAIAGYLRRGRPRSVPAREVFVQARPPHAGLGRDGVSRIVARVASDAGIGVVRAHRLRHTAATDMLRAGASLGEIGQVLRHRSAGSTAAYARVDLGRLRTIARPWPTGAES